MEALAPLLGRLQQQSAGSDPSVAALATAVIEEMRFLREELKFWKERCLKLEDDEEQKETLASMTNEVEKTKKGNVELLTLLFTAANLLEQESPHEQDVREILDAAKMLGRPS
jgi:hypothetical protein